MNKLKNIFQCMQKAFNSIYIKALYFTIALVLISVFLFILICNYPIFILIFSLIIFTTAIYVLVLDYLEGSK